MTVPNQHVTLDIGLSSDGRIVLRFYDEGVGCESEIAMSLSEARALVAHLEDAIRVAAALPEGRHISMGEGRA
jgi:hypothetical protein